MATTTQTNDEVARSSFLFSTSWWQVVRTYVNKFLDLPRIYFRENRVIGGSCRCVRFFYHFSPLSDAARRRSSLEQHTIAIIPAANHTLTMMLPTTSTTVSHSHRRNGHFPIKSAYNFVLSLLVLHWCYMISQMFLGDATMDKEPFLFSPKEPQELIPHEPYDFDFDWDWHPRNRSDRFPTCRPTSPAVHVQLVFATL